MCRWPVIPAPATLPRFIPTLNPPGAPPLLPPDAEDAPGPARAVPPDPLHPPGREHPFHRKRSAVDQFPQFLADFEEGDPLLGDGDFLPGLGVASLLGPAEADGETAEPPELDLLPSSRSKSRKEYFFFGRVTTRGSPSIFAIFPASATASSRLPSVSIRPSSFACSPDNMRPSAIARTASRGRFRPSATAFTNWEWTLSITLWRSFLSSGLISRIGAPGALQRAP